MWRKASDGVDGAMAMVERDGGQKPKRKRKRQGDEEGGNEKMNSTSTIPVAS